MSQIAQNPAARLRPTSLAILADIETTLADIAAQDHRADEALMAQLDRIVLQVETNANSTQSLLRELLAA